MTLRQDIVATAARYMRPPVGSSDLAEWLECHPAAGAVAASHGMTRDEMQDAIDNMNWLRLVAAVNRRAR